MKMLTAIGIVVLLSLGLLVNSSAQVLLQSKVLDVSQIESQKIDLRTLPDSQLIRIGTVTKSLGELRQNRSLRIARDKQVAISYMQLVQSNFTKRKTDLTNMYAARDSKNAYTLKEMVSKFPRTAIPTFNTAKLKPGSLINPPGPPQSVSIDKNQGQKGEAFLIQGTNFQVFMLGQMQQVVDVKPRVLILVAPGVFMDAIVQVWSNTQIIATVPDNTGDPGYNGYIYVETKIGKSNFMPFRIDPDLAVVMLDSREGTHTLMPCNFWDLAPEVRTDFCVPHTSCRPSADPPEIVYDHIEVWHSPLGTTGCSYTDYLWQSITLRNGWVVDTVYVYRITESSDVVSLANSPVGTYNPMLQIGCTINEEVMGGLCYYASVIIKGPKGTSWK